MAKLLEGKPIAEKIKEEVKLKAAELKAKGITYAEYTYTSNLLKSSIVSAKLGKDAAIYFRIPIGHTTKVIR